MLKRNLYNSFIIIQKHSYKSAANSRVGANDIKPIKCKYFLFYFPNLDSFLQQHPIQPTEDASFNPDIAYNRTSINGEKVPRQWISYSTNMKAIFCYICLSFCNAHDAPFSIKVSDKNYLYTRLSEQEYSHCHNAVVEAYRRTFQKLALCHICSVVRLLSARGI